MVVRKTLRIPINKRATSLGRRKRFHISSRKLNKHMKKTSLQLSNNIKRFTRRRQTHKQSGNDYDY